MKPSPLIITTCFIAILRTCASSNAISAQPLTTKILSVGIAPQFNLRKTRKTWHPILKKTEELVNQTTSFHASNAPAASLIIHVDLKVIPRLTAGLAKFYQKQSKFKE